MTVLVHKQLPHGVYTFDCGYTICGDEDLKQIVLNGVKLRRMSYLFNVLPLGDVSDMVVYKTLNRIPCRIALVKFEGAVALMVGFTNSDDTLLWAAHPE